ncbi:unnamed protein product [Amoebophrya sp. A120]|nr:unnamed protein product [Amoebophrya sp. A120]|eukprot:GSA120T00008198001.1
MSTSNPCPDPSWHYHAPTRRCYRYFSPDDDDLFSLSDAISSPAQELAATLASGQEEQDSQYGWPFLTCQTQICEAFNATVATVVRENEDFLWRVVVDKKKRLDSMQTSFGSSKPTNLRSQDPFLRFWVGLYRGAESESKSDMQAWFWVEGVPIASSSGNSLFPSNSTCASSTSLLENIAFTRISPGQEVNTAVSTNADRDVGKFLASCEQHMGGGGAAILSTTSGTSGSSSAGSFQQEELRLQIAKHADPLWPTKLVGLKKQLPWARYEPDGGEQFKLERFSKQLFTNRHDCVYALQEKLWGRSVWYDTDCHRRLPCLCQSNTVANLAFHTVDAVRLSELDTREDPFSQQFGATQWRGAIVLVFAAFTLAFVVSVVNAVVQRIVVRCLHGVRVTTPPVSSRPTSTVEQQMTSSSGGQQLAIAELKEEQTVEDEIEETETLLPLPQFYFFRMAMAACVRNSEGVVIALERAKQAYARLIHSDNFLAPSSLSKNVNPATERPDVLFLHSVDHTSSTAAKQANVSTSRTRRYYLRDEQSIYISPAPADEAKMLKTTGIMQSYNPSSYATSTTASTSPDEKENATLAASTHYRNKPAHHFLLSNLPTPSLLPRYAVRALMFVAGFSWWFWRLFTDEGLGAKALLLWLTLFLFWMFAIFGPYVHNFVTKLLLFDLDHTFVLLTRPV